MQANWIKIDLVKLCLIDDIECSYLPRSTALQTSLWRYSWLYSCLVFSVVHKPFIIKMVVLVVVATINKLLLSLW